MWLHFRVEGGDERNGGVGVGVERGADLFVTIGCARLNHVFAKRAQHGDFADVAAMRANVVVEVVVFARACPDADEGFDDVGEVGRRGVAWLEATVCEVNAVALQPVAVGEAVIAQGQHRQAEIFQNVCHLLEADDFVVFAIEAEAQLIRLDIVVPKLHGQRVIGAKVGECFGIIHRLRRCVFFAVGESENVVKTRERFISYFCQRFAKLRIPCGKCLQACVEAGFLTFSHVATPMFLRCL